MSRPVKCDYRPCGRLSSSKGTYYHLDMGMFRRLGDAESYDFCSWDCLSKYAASRVPEEAPLPAHYKLDRHGQPYDPTFEFKEQPDDQVRRDQEPRQLPEPGRG